MRGYCGIGIYQWKKEVNIGTLWRSAQALGADFVFTVGRQYERQSSDTTAATNHLPLFQFQTLEQMEEHKPRGCLTVCVEMTDGAIALPGFVHPTRAIYLLGAEDGGLPAAFTATHITVAIPSSHCLNVSTAGSIVLYDRTAKMTSSLAKVS